MAGIDDMESIAGIFPFGNNRNTMGDEFFKPVIKEYEKEDFAETLVNYLQDPNDMHKYILCKKGAAKNRNNWRYYASTIISFDTETTSIDIPNKGKFAYVYIWQLAVQRYVFVGRDIKDFVEACWILHAIFKTDDKHRIIIWVHNLKYDFNFIRKLFKWKDCFWKDKHDPLYAVNTFDIEFRCSYMLSGKSLANISGTDDIDEWTGKPKNTSILLDTKFKKKKGDLDYRLTRNRKTKLTKEEMEYCVNDVLVINEYITEIMNDNLLDIKYKTLGDIPFTQTGVVRNLYRENTLRNKVPQRRQEYVKLMENLTITEKEYEMAKMAFLGGFTHANSKYVNETLTDVASADLASSYPGVIACCKFPMSKGRYKPTITNEEYEFYINNGYYTIMVVNFYNFRIKENMPDMIATGYKAMHSRKLNASNNGRVVSADEIMYTLTNIDFDNFKLYYDFDDYVILDTYVYKADYLPYEFVEVLLDLYEKKTKLKGIEERIVEYNCAKSNINSSYGMMVTDVFKQTYKYDPQSDSWELDRKTATELIDKYNNDPSRFTSYIWGVFVTAHARNKLFRLMLQMGDHYVYADTDSNKILCFEKLKEIIELENSRITYDIDRVVAERGIPKERFAPRDKKGKEHPIGIWELENIDDSRYLRFKTIGAKRYIYETNDYNAKEKKYIKRVHVTCAGWNKEKAMQYMAKSEQDPFIIFNEEFEVSSDDSGKMQSQYSDNIENYITEADVIDYQGNEDHIVSPSWIYMSPIPYSATMAVDFSYWLQKYYSQKPKREER